MTRVSILALSRWAHHSWFPRGERTRSERAQANANASLLARMPQLANALEIPPMPSFATLPRPACAKVIRLTAALAHAHILRKVVSASARETFAIRVAPYVLRTIQSTAHAECEGVETGATLNVLDRSDMAAAGLRIALRAHEDPVLRALLQLRLPRAIVERASRYPADCIDPQAASHLLEAACVLVGAASC